MNTRLRSKQTNTIPALLGFYLDLQHSPHCQLVEISSLSCWMEVLGAALPLEEAAYSPLRTDGCHSKLSAVQTMFSFIRVKRQLHTYLGQETWGTSSMEPKVTGNNQDLQPRKSVSFNIWGCNHSHPTTLHKLPPKLSYRNFLTLLAQSVNSRSLHSNFKFFSVWQYTFSG